MEVFLDKGTMEFLTVASEYCAFVEKARKFTRKDFVTKLHKILALTYLKMTLLKDDPEYDPMDGEPEAFLSEYDYEHIRGIVSEKLGSLDHFIDITHAAMYDGETEQMEVSQCIADVYHNLKNFAENFRTGSEESAQASRAELIGDFRDTWGPRALALLAALHTFVYSPEIDDEEDDYYNNASNRPRSTGNSLLDNYMDSYRQRS
ncbi:MAG: DUF5063 domain-containing protein [Bacteroidales bacterium]|nr:DUF5063 domain-containing protein [Bacteroidales bacterium]